MSSIGGPNIVENGLVLSYDVANTKSFRGIPTTNLALFNIASSGFNTDTPGNLTQTSNNTEFTYKGRPSRKMVIGSGYWNCYIFSYNTSITSAVFTVSFKVKANDGSNPSTFISGGYIYGSQGTFFPTPSFTLIDDGWYVCHITYSGTAMFLNSLTGVNGGGGPKTFYITDYQVEDKDQFTPFTPNTRGANVISGGGVINQSKINSNNGTISNPFASPEEAQKFGYPAGNYYFKSGSMGSAELLEFAPNYYEGKPFCCVFRSPYRSTATTNKIGLNIPMGGLLVQRDTLDLRAAVYWSAPITYNSVGGSGNNTADSGHTPRRVILGFAGGHGIFATNQDQCNWGSATGAIGAGWDGSTCGSFPNDLIWGTGRSDTATYENRSGVWSHWITWTDFNAGGELVNGVTFSRDNQGSFLFDGVNDYINIPTFTTKPLTQISCECWIRPNKPSIGGTIRGGAISSTNSMYLGIIDSVDGGNTFAMHWANQTTNSRLFNWNGSVPNNQWSHLVGTYNGSIMRAYLNGIEIYSVAQTGTIPDATYVVGTYGLTLTDVTHNFHGRISNVKIYNVGLTANEVLQNYNATKGRFGL